MLNLTDFIFSNFEWPPVKIQFSSPPLASMMNVRMNYMPRSRIILRLVTRPELVVRITVRYEECLLVSSQLTSQTNQQTFS